MKRFIVVTLAGITLLAALVTGWTGFNRIQELERRLEDARHKTETLEQKARENATEMERTLQLAIAARESAETAARNAAEAAAGRINAESKTQAAEEARKHAETEAQQSRQELTEVQQRREEELNRMQEALARISATRRTPTGLVVELANDSFRFDFDKATLRPENREILSRIAGVLLASNGYRLFIHGHTDDIGSAEYNQQLSNRRAKSVADYLIEAGVDKNVVETRGFGKSSPRAQTRDAQGRQQNRRVEIVLVDSVIHYKQEARFMQ